MDKGTIISVNISGSLKHAIRHRRGHGSYYGLVTDVANTSQYAINIDAPISIVDWASEDPLPIYFRAVGHNRGSFISKADLRSVDPPGGEYAIRFQVPVGGLLVLDGVNIDAAPTAVNAPNISMSGPFKPPATPGYWSSQAPSLGPSQGSPSKKTSAESPSNGATVRSSSPLVPKTDTVSAVPEPLNSSVSIVRTLIGTAKLAGPAMSTSPVAESK